MKGEHKSKGDSSGSVMGGGKKKGRVFLGGAISEGVILETNQWLIHS